MTLTLRPISNDDATRETCFAYHANIFVLEFGALWSYITGLFKARRTKQWFMLHSVLIISSLSSSKLKHC
jgi:hypothetical protein